MKNRILKSSVAVILVAAMAISGCSTAWIDVALKDLPVVVQIVSSILAIADVSAVPQAQAAGGEAQRDLQLLNAAIADYRAAQTAQAQANALTAMQNALSAANGHLNDILTAVHVKDPAKQAAISAGVGVALSVLVSIQALLPSNAPKVAHAVKLPNHKEVKRQFNSAMAGAYPGAVLR